jgi:HK97 gp10 family phage protein
MASGVRLEVEGLDKLIKKMGKLPQHVVNEVDAEMDGVARGYVNKAVAAAPVDTGYLKNGITFTRLSPMNFEIVSSAPYSAYVEFGTITMVSVPAELTSYAAQFKGKGIKKTGGMPARPFFFVQVPWAQVELNKHLKEVVKRAMAK